MAKSKEIKTNAMRFPDRQKVAYEVLQYACDEFTDGIAVANKTGVPVAQSYNYKTVVDDSARSFDWIAVSGGRIGSTIKIAPEALAKASGAEFAAVTSERETALL